MPSSRGADRGRRDRDSRAATALRQHPQSARRRHGRPGRPFPGLTAQTQRVAPRRAALALLVVMTLCQSSVAGSMFLLKRSGLCGSQSAFARPSRGVLLGPLPHPAAPLGTVVGRQADAAVVAYVRLELRVHAPGGPTGSACAPDLGRREVMGAARRRSPSRRHVHGVRRDLRVMRAGGPPRPDTAAGRGGPPATSDVFRAQRSARRSSSVRVSERAATFCSRCATDPVPGIVSVVGDRASTCATAT